MTTTNQLRQQVNDRIITALHTGTVPWRSDYGFTRNILSRRRFDGLSGLLLMIACDIACEDGTAQTGMKNVQNALADMLKSALTADSIVVKDNGSGEIADFIVIQPKSRIVAFYHCKATKKPKNGHATPGVRVDDLYEFSAKPAATGLGSGRPTSSRRS
jgi:hypothetical protein